MIRRFLQVCDVIAQTAVVADRVLGGPDAHSDAVDRRLELLEHALLIYMQDCDTHRFYAGWIKQIFRPVVTAEDVAVPIELDDLICLVHSAWIAGFIADDAKSGLERQWRRKAVGVAAEIKNITNRAFRAHEKKAEPEVDDALSDGALSGETFAESADAVVVEKPKRAKKTSIAVPPAVEPTDLAIA